MIDQPQKLNLDTVLQEVAELTPGYIGADLNLLYQEVYNLAKVNIG